MENSRKIEISVLMITFNHERFIAQTIESVFMQECDYSFELIIGDDCSTDNTVSIIKSYIDKYPDRIQLIQQPVNTGGKQNFMSTYHACTGTFIAMLDGDDYWSDEKKLQTQVEFLLANPETSLCAHDAKRVQEINGTYIDVPSDYDPKDLSELSDIVKGNLFFTSAVVFRRACLPTLPPWFETLFIGDWTLFILLAEQGKLGFIRKKMSVYRMHDKGVWVGADDFSNIAAIIDLFEHFDNYFERRFHHIVKQPLSRFYVAYSDRLVNRQNRKEALAKLVKSLSLDISTILWWNFWKVLVKAMSPATHRFLKAFNGAN